MEDGDYAEAAASIAAGLPYLPVRAGGTRVLALDGPSGAGKTTLAGVLQQALDAPVLHLDALYPGWDGLADVVPNLLRWVLKPLAGNLPAGYHRWDWEAGGYAEWHQLPPAPVVVVEGVGAGARLCAPYLSLLVWVDAPADVRFARGIARDGEAYRPHWQHWADQEEAHYLRERTPERADLFVRGARQEAGLS